MKYTLVLNDFNHTAKEQLRKLSSFIIQNKLSSEDSCAIIFYDPKEDAIDNLLSLSSVIPAKQAEFVATEKYQAETCLSYLESHTRKASLILFLGDIWGNELCIRFACRVKGTCLRDIQALTINNISASAKKAIYSGHLVGHFSLKQAPYLVSIDKNYREEILPSIVGAKEITFFQTPALENSSLKLSPLPQKKDLNNSQCILILGRGMKTKDNVSKIAKLAQNTGIPLAGSRPCIMNAWLPLDRLVGVSGSILDNKLVILLGISGAPAFYSGVERCKHIISINSDPAAAIMKKSDLSIIGNCTEIISEFFYLLKEGCHES